MIVLYILLFILILGLLVCFHEYGHYHFAKKAGIQINEFSFGMGPKLLSKKKGDTYWSIRAFPIGGFCAMSGEDADVSLLKEGQEVRLIFDSENKVNKIIVNADDPEYQLCEKVKIEKVDLFGKDDSPLYINEYEVRRDALILYSKKEEYRIAPEERSYVSKSVWQRFLVCFGGPLNNLLLGLVVFLILGLMMGVANTDKSIVGEGNGVIVAGDEIKSIDGYSIEKWEDIGEAIDKTGRHMEIEIVRDGENKTVYCDANYYLLNMSIYSAPLDNEHSDGIYVKTEVPSNTGGTTKTEAYKAGLRNNDKLYSLKYNNETVIVEDWTWDQLINYSIDNLDGGTLEIMYYRDGVLSENPVSVELMTNRAIKSQGYDKNALKQIGISCSSTFSFFGGIKNALLYFWQAASMIFSTLGLLLFTNDIGINQMGGIITILDQTANYASSMPDLLYWIGLLSVNLGIVNLLPIPALDGGRILFIIVEGITGKKLKPKTENIIINVFFWLLMGLIIYILIQDIIRFGYKFDVSAFRYFLR